MADCPTLLVGQFAHSKICTVLHISAHLRFSKMQLCNHTHLKSAFVWPHFLATHLKSVNVHLHFLVALLKSASVRLQLLVALFKSVIVRLHFFFHFSNVRQKVRSYNSSFKEGRMCKNLWKLCKFSNCIFFPL